jgi:RNA polymerase sigma-70 factor (ECF subfamily)
VYDAAFLDAYRDHGHAVHAVASRICGASLAIDVTQDVFLRLWLQPDKFDPQRGSLRTYLLVLTRHRAVDAVRSESALRARERIAEPSWSSTATPDDALLRRDLAVRVLAGLEQLTTEQRQAIVLAFYDGLSYHEVAALLGQPEGTIKGRIRSGLRSLRTILAEVVDADQFPLEAGMPSRTARSVAATA